jgi:hypothetical protein
MDTIIKKFNVEAAVQSVASFTYNWQLIGSY